MLNVPNGMTGLIALARARAAFVSITLFISSAAAGHEGATHSHENDEKPLITPRDADSHETGTLPRARSRSNSFENKVDFVIENDFRYVVANGIPNHETGPFPNRGNPNVVGEQDYTFRIPLDPSPPEAPVESIEMVFSDRGYLFGIALNGVPFEPATGLNWTPEGVRRGGPPGDWVHEAIGGSVDFGIDYANAHVQRTGAYHYHGIPTPLIHEDRPTLLGYAADGYPIYGPIGYENPENADSPLVRLQSSWSLKTEDRPGSTLGPGGKPDGRYTADWEFRPGSGDLDFLNGRFAVTPEYPRGVYHYVLTTTFPYVPRGFAGRPDRSFRRTPGQGPNHVSERGNRLSIGDR